MIVRSRWAARSSARCWRSCLLHANESVSVDGLIDGVWGERPPATAVKTTQGYIARLRRALDQSEHKTAGSSNEILVTRGHGYLLRVSSSRHRSSTAIPRWSRGREMAGRPVSRSPRPSRRGRASIVSGGWRSAFWRWSRSCSRLWWARQASAGPRRVRCSPPIRWGRSARPAAGSARTCRWRVRRRR